jgi:hypothetical protein
MLFLNKNCSKRSINLFDFPAVLVINSKNIDTKIFNPSVIFKSSKLYSTIDLSEEIEIKRVFSDASRGGTKRTSLD